MGLTIVSPNKQKTIYRKKNIIFEDYLRSKTVKNTSKILSCRNPFRPDDTLINYDLDTEDELAEE
jgi:hypothetical protein